MKGRTPTAAEKARFEQKYGTQESLLQEVQELLQ